MGSEKMEPFDVVGHVVNIPRAIDIIGDVAYLYCIICTNLKITTKYEITKAYRGKNM